MNDPDATGQLVYPIKLDGIPASALLDHGISTCFIDREWVDRNDYQTRKLSKPLKLIEFTGSQNYVQHEVCIDVVSFAGMQRPWSFLVSPRSPYSVVIGLDLIRSWPLYYNPCNDRILSVPTSNPSLIHPNSTPPSPELNSAETPLPTAARGVHSCSVTLAVDESVEEAFVKFECKAEHVRSALTF